MLWETMRILFSRKGTIVLVLLILITSNLNILLLGFPALGTPGDFS